MTSDLELFVGVDGSARCIYDEALDLREIGKLQITRASHVEPDRDGFWWADMGPVRRGGAGAVCRKIGSAFRRTGVGR